MTEKTAIYLRVSTEEQADNGYGLDVQREKCHAMAAVKDWSVVAEFIDDGVSGTKDESERDGLNQLLEAACAGEVDAVIVAALDRLGRKTTLIIDLVDRLTGCGVEFVSCKESIDTSTAAGRFVLTIFAGLAQLERDNIVERTTDGRNERGKVDGERGGRLPYGYKRVFDAETGKAVGVELNQETADNVRRIFSERSDGETLTAIADGLNADGIVSPRGAKWYASSVRSVLQNESAYNGGQRWQSEVRWPVILA